MQKHPRTDDDLFIALRSVDPAASIRVDRDQMAVLLSESISSANRGSMRCAPAKTRRSRKQVWITGSLVAALALGISSPAIADGVRYMAQTGWFGSPNPGSNAHAVKSTESDSSEWLDSSKSDFVAYASTLVPHYVTLPPDVDRAHFATVFAEGLHSHPSLMQVTGVKGAYETAARCLWINEWLVADVQGADGARTATAAQQIMKASTWTVSVTRSDKLTIAVYRSLGTAAQTGNRPRLEKEMQLGCDTFVEALAAK